MWYYIRCVLTGAVLVQLPAVGQAQAPTITATTPLANTAAVARMAPVTVTFSQPLSASSATALKIYSAQRGGQRASGAAQATVSGATLTFTPNAYGFLPGETIFSTITTAATSTGSTALAKPKVMQFTAAVGRTGTGTFSGSVEQGVGSYAQGVVVGDVNGDGALDLLTANSNDNTVSVQLGNGKGSFSGTASVSVGNGPYGLVLSDVDGDGDLDVLTANFFDNTVSVRLNDGAGTFSGGSDAAVGVNPFGITAGDVDGDGDLDVLAANFFDNTVSVLLNDGKGLLTSTTAVAVGDNPFGVVLGDVDGDGALDLLTANHNASGTLSVRLNDGLGNFGGGSDPAVGSNPFGLKLADVDGDGDLDVLASNSLDNTVSVLFNNAKGTFATTTAVSVGHYPQSIAVGDVDGDGDLDLLTVNNDDNTVSVRLNNGKGAFSGGSNPAVGSNPVGMAVGDVDGDGNLDVLTANYNASGTVSVRVNGSTAPLPVELTAFTATLAPGGTAVALAWATASEQRSARFEVERSLGGTAFALIGTVAAAGYSTTPRTYALADDAPPTGAPTLYYRLRQIDDDGTSTYSPVRAVARSHTSAPQLLAYPNPARTAVQVWLGGAAPTATLQVLDAMGKLVRTQPVPIPGAMVGLPLDGLSPGIYVLHYGTLSQRLVVE